MALLSSVVVDVPTQRPFLCRWPQPYELGDDALDWSVTTNGVTRKVQRDRLTDDVLWCSCLVDQGPSLAAGSSFRFDVDTGDLPTPSTAWVAPALDKLGVQFTGHDGSVHKANFLDTTMQDIVRDGHYLREMRRYTLSTITTVGAGTQALGATILAFKAYIRYRADFPDILEVDFDMCNGKAQVETNQTLIASRGGGLHIESAPTTIGFTDCVVTVPTGWTLTAFDRPLAGSATIPLGSTAHAFPKRMGTGRRWVFSKNANAAAPLAATEAGQLLGLGRAEYAAGLRSYHTVKSWGPTKSYIPDLSIGQGFTGGYAQAKAYCNTAFNSLNSLATTGISGAITQPVPGGGTANVEFGTGPVVARFGLFHPAGGTAAEGAADGHDIEVYCGARFHIREFVRHAMLYSGMKMDGTGVYLWDFTTGRQLRNRDFANQYLGGAIGYVTSGSTAGYRPFAFETDQNSGGEYRAPRQQSFAGFTPRIESWPPHFLASTGIGNGDNKWWPELQANWGVPTRSLWDFTCEYRPVLEQIPVPNGPLIGGKPIYIGGTAGTYAHFESTPGTQAPQGASCWRDPEDDQHAIRTYTKLIPCAWLAGDLMSIDRIETLAEFYAYRWSEISTAITGDTNLDNFCLPRRLALQSSPFPNAARIGMGRGAAWMMRLAAAHYALSTVADRETGYGFIPKQGIRWRCEQMFDLCRLGIITQSGQTAIGCHPGGTTSAYAPLPVETGCFESGPAGATIPHGYGVFQAGLELPKVYAGFWALLKQLDSVLPQASIDHAESLLMVGFNDYVARTSLYALEGAGPSRGPANFVATWTLVGGPASGGSAVTGSDSQAAILRGPPGSGSHWDDNTVIVEIAYRITGDPTVFRCLNSLGGQLAPGTSPIIKANQLLNATCAYAMGLVACVKYLPGADAPFAPTQTNPAVTASASPNPVTQGQLCTISATVTNGHNPESTGLAVTADLSSFNGPSAAAFTDQGGGLWTYDFDTTGAFPSTFSVPVTVTDAELRTGATVFDLEVAPQSTAPTVTLIASPSPVVAGSVLTLFADVVLGTAPLSTGTLVTVDLSAFGLSDVTPMLDGGVAPDVAAADLRFTCAFTPTAGFEGTYTLTAKVIDDQLRTAMSDATVKVSAAPVAGSDPSVILRVNANPITAGNTITLTALVTKSTDGASITSVFVDLTSLGGPASFELLDDGIAPDVTALDLTYTGSYATSAALATSTYSLPCVVLDRVGRTGSDKLGLAVNAVVDPTDPLIFGSASPNPITQTQTVTFTAFVVAGSAPPSTGLAATLDLTAFGLTNAEPMHDDGGGTWTYSLLIGLDVPAVRYPITFSLIDDQLRTATDTITLYVAALVPSGQGDAFLPVYDGTDILAVPLNAAERLEITDETGAVFEIQNSPNVSASNGGQLPVLLEDGVTTILVPFIVLEVPQGPVVVGTATGGERVGQARLRREVAHAS